jgi:predicted permease
MNHHPWTLFVALLAVFWILGISAAILGIRAANRGNVESIRKGFLLAIVSMAIGFLGSKVVRFSYEEHETAPSDQVIAKDAVANRSLNSQKFFYIPSLAGAICLVVSLGRWFRRPKNR